MRMAPSLEPDGVNVGSGKCAIASEIKLAPLQRSGELGNLGLDLVGILLAAAAKTASRSMYPATFSAGVRAWMNDPKYPRKPLNTIRPLADDLAQGLPRGIPSRGR
jgi:hypothetical protein